MVKFKFIDLFAGIGGFHLAMHELGGDCVFASEIDIQARKTYEHNFKNISPNLFRNEMFNDDIRKISAEEIPDFDVLSEDPAMTAKILKTRLEDNGLKNVKIIKKDKI